MRIRHPAPQVLVVRTAAVRRQAIGLLCIVAAGLLFINPGGLVPAGPREWLAPMLVVVAGLLWRSTSTQVVTLDRREGVARVRTQHLLGSSLVTYRLADVADVVLERWNESQGREVYRPALVMRNGTHQGFGVLASLHARREQVAAVRVMREFLGTATALTAPDGSVAIQGVAA